MGDQPQGILKPPKQGSKKKKKSVGIVWDEDNLQKNEEEKEPRMKIDEPKTPYVSYEGGDEDDPVFPASPEEQPGIPQSEIEAAISRLEGERAHDNVWEMDDSEEENGVDAADHENESEEFRRKRKMHYDEYLRLKEFRAKHPNLSDDEEEEEEEDDTDFNNDVDNDNDDTEMEAADTH